MPDGPDILRMRNEPHVRRGMLNDSVIQEADHAEWMEATISSAFKSYFLVTLEDLPIGVIGFYAMNGRNLTSEWSFYFSNSRPHDEPRLVTSSLLLALHYLFEIRSFRRLYSQVLATNTASLRIHRRLGFLDEALLRENVLIDGHGVDVRGLGLLATEWPTVRSQWWTRLLGKVDSRITR